MMFYVNYNRILIRTFSSKQRSENLNAKNSYSKLVQELINAKIYLGSTVSDWNPKVKYGLMGIRTNFCIIDPRRTAVDLSLALALISKLTRKKKIKSRRYRKPVWKKFKKPRILFVGFPKSQQEICKALYKSKRHYYIEENYWVNGLLTNGGKFASYRNKFLKNYWKQEDKDKELFFQHFEGILDLNQKPDLVFIYNYSKGIDAFREANSLRIPVISFIDSSDNPELVGYSVLGNFNSKEAEELYLKLIKRFLK